MPLVVTQQILPHLAPDVVVTAAGEDLVEEGGDLRDHPVAVDVELPVQLTDRRLAGTLVLSLSGHSRPVVLATSMRLSSVVSLPSWMY